MGGQIRLRFMQGVIVTCGRVGGSQGAVVKWSDVTQISMLRPRALGSGGLESLQSYE